MKIGGCDIITCGEMKCVNHDCDKRLYLAENELGCYVAIPGLDCPEKQEWWRKKTEAYKGIMQNTAEKPSRGPKPYYVWIAERIRELAAAIDEYSARSYNHVTEWALEIALLKKAEKALNKVIKENAERSKT